MLYKKTIHALKGSIVPVIFAGLIGTIPATVTLASDNSHQGHSMAGKGATEEEQHHDHSKMDHSQHGGNDADSDPHAQHKKMLKSNASYTRTVQNYRLPDVTLTDMNNEQVSLRKELDYDGPILVNFIFTTCTTICPIMTATFAQVQSLLGEEVRNVRMVSISIDPEQDTPEKLRAYAQKFDAGESWHFLTGNLDDIVMSLKAMDAYRGNKMNHVPVTLIRASAKADWIRMEGMTSAEDLVNEYRQLVAKL